MNTNHTCDYLEILGFPPSLGDYTDPRRWDAWNKYERAKSKLCCFSNHIDEDGSMRYHKLLRSQITRQFREGNMRHVTPYRRHN